MSRSNYTDDCDLNLLNLWRANVDRTVAGKRGQQFLQEMADALDAMPVKKLIDEVLIQDGEVCALGAVALRRSMCCIDELDAQEPEDVAKAFGISAVLAQEIAYVNDECGPSGYENDEMRWMRVREWVRNCLELKKSDPNRRNAEWKP